MQINRVRLGILECLEEIRPASITKGAQYENNELHLLAAYITALLIVS
jgi:hypothetical protein